MTLFNTHSSIIKEVILLPDELYLAFANVRIVPISAAINDDFESQFKLS